MIQFMKDMIKDKPFLKMLFVLAIPIVIQNLISSSLNMIDTLMIGRLGEGEIAAVGLANQLFLLIITGLTGICAGAGVFISQYWGKKDLMNIKRMLGLALTVGSIYALVITVFVQCFPSQSIGFFNKDPKILELGTVYLQIVSISYIFTAITFAYSFALRCIGRTQLPMVASGIAVAINVIFNTVFIFGLGEFMLAITGNEICWGLGSVVYTKAYGHIGYEAVTSVQIVNTITNFFLVVIFALASAVLTIVGNAIGEGDVPKAKLYAKRIIVLSMGIGILICLGIILLAPFIVSCFNVTPEVAHVTVNILLINAVIIIPRVFTIVMIMGIFRGGGDTRYSLILESSTMWLIGVPLSFIGAYLLGFRLEYVVAMIMMEELVKSIFCMVRFKSSKWIHNMVEH